MQNLKIFAGINADCSLLLFDQCFLTTQQKKHISCLIVCQTGFSDSEKMLKSA